MATSAVEPSGESIGSAGLAGPFSVRDFRILWAGETISILGSHFNLLALPWLVLKLTGSGLALGTVLMVEAFPRAALMLVGGAATDLFSPRRIMLASNLARGLLVAALAAVVSADLAELWVLYVFALLYGVADAFFYPGYTSILPQVLKPGMLQAGNSVLQGSAQLAGLLGPATAGVVVASVSIAAAFWVDSASFFVAFLALLLMASGNAAVRKAGAPLNAPDVWRSTVEGLRYAWRDPVVRGLLVVTAIVNLAFTGPFVVGSATLAERRFGGAVALGMMMSALGGGALLGSLLAGIVPRVRRRGLLLVTVLLVFGFGLVGMGAAPGVRTAMAILAVTGVASGFTNILAITLLQTRTAPEMLGRVMSVVMLNAAGLIPFSFVLAGALAERGTVLMFAAAGGLVLLLAGAGVAYRPVWEFD